MLVFDLDRPRIPGGLSIAFVVPMQGPTGMYGPSCLACGQLAVEQLNAVDGIAGRQVELLVVDAGRDPEVVAAHVAGLVATGRVDAVAGWHISAVRTAVARRIAGRVVYAYAAMHEGYDDTPGVVMLGERPANQLLPSLTWMREHLGARRWAVVGNDYVFPRVTGATARAALAGSGSQIVAEMFEPFGTTDFTGAVERLQRLELDGVVMLLMGQDAVHFSRQFTAAGLDERLVRLSPAVDENVLLGAGPEANTGLYAAAAFFDGLATVESADFAATYHARFGPLAPTLNAIGESCYEALRFLARLGDLHGSIRPDAVEALGSGHFYETPRGLVRLDGNLADQEVHIARADGLQLVVEDRIASLGRRDPQR